jgi:polyhydroxyalkanoate synthesis regulator phasin
VTAAATARWRSRRQRRPRRQSLRLASATSFRSRHPPRVPLPQRSVNAAASAAAHALMAERADSARELAEKLVLAGVGAVALTAERADALAEEVAARGGIGRDEARSMVEELMGRWRSETVRLSERTGSGLAGVFREVGLVTRGELEEIELRVAQLEHRLRLLERSD